MTRLARWYEEMDKSDFLAFGRVARSIQTHYLEIINFFEKRSTNALSESVNAKIKNFRSQLRGVKDKAFFLFRLAKFMLYQRIPQLVTLSTDILILKELFKHKRGHFKIFKMTSSL